MISTDAAPVAIDFEATYDKKAKLTIRGLGAYKYLKQADIYLVSIYDGESLFVGHPKDFDWSSISGRKKLSHNRSLDKLAYKVLREKFPDEIEEMNTDDWECTADMAAYLKCKRALQDAVRILLGEEMSKDTRTKMNKLTVEMMKESVMAANGKLYPISSYPPEVQVQFREVDENGWDHTFFGDVHRYAGDDAIYCWRLWEKFNHLFPERERRLSRMTTDQAHRGLLMDRQALEKDAEVLRKVKDVARQYLPWAPKDPNDEEGILSIPKLQEAIRALGVEPPTTTSEDSQVLRKWEKDHPEIRYTKSMRDFRKANILLRRVEHILDRLMDNGRFPFAWRYAGAHTLRWAGGSNDKSGGTGETGFNVQNQAKEPTYITCDYEMVSDLETTKAIEAGEVAEGFVLYKVDLRARVIAPKGKKLVVFDASQIEPRILKWLVTLLFPGTAKAADCADTLQRIANGESIYEVHARKKMGWTGGDIKKENPRQQFFAKQQVISLGYGCGPVKYHDRLLEFGVDLPLKECKTQVGEYRAKEKGITSIWYRLDGDFKDCRCTKAGCAHKDCGANYVIELPDGSELTYFDVHYSRRAPKSAKDNFPTGKDKPTKEAPSSFNSKKSIQWCARTERGGRIKWFYGGLITENVVQRLAREVMCDMLLACDDQGWTSLFSAHDEGVLEVDEDVALDDVVAAVTISPEWAEGLPIAVDAKESQHYFKD